MIVQSERELILDLTCEELCLLRNREDLEKEVRKELKERNCPCCYCR